MADIDFTPVSADGIDFTPIETADDGIDFTPLPDAKTPDFSGQTKRSNGPLVYPKVDGPQLNEAPADSLLERVRQNLSPLLGPTEQQKLEESVDGKYKPLGSKVDQEGFFPALSHPAIALPRLNVQSVEAPKTAAAINAVVNTAEGFGEFLESPLGVATAGAGGVPRAAKAISALYAADMAAKVPEAAARAGTISVTGTPQQKMEADLGLGTQIVLPAVLGSHPAADVADVVNDAADTAAAKVADWKARMTPPPDLRPSEFGGLPEAPDTPVIDFTEIPAANAQPAEEQPAAPASSAQPSAAPEATETSEDQTPAPLVVPAETPGVEAEENPAIDFTPETEPAPAAASPNVQTDDPAAAPSFEQRLSDWADQTIADASKRLNAGIDPTVLAAYGVKGALFIKNGLVDFGQWSAEMVRQFGEEMRPQLQALFQQANGLAQGENLRAFGQKILADPDVSDAVKAQVSEYTYEPRSNETDAAAAQRLIAAHGVDEATRVYMDSQVKMPGAVRSLLGEALIKQVGAEELRLRTKGDTAGAERMASKQVDLIDHTLRGGTNAAQTLQAMNAYSKMSAQGILKHARRTFGDAGDREVERLKPTTDVVKDKFRQANDAAVQGTIADPKVNEAARAAVNDAVTNSAATRRGVVVEITGALADSPEVMRQARQQLSGGELNKILQQRGLKLGTTSKAELDGIMGDLAKRAAGIAASHYQGAEVGVSLADKLQQRLGLSKEASGRLAKSLDLTFASMVKKAQERIPWRIAQQRAKLLAPFDPNELNPSAIDREIRTQLKAQNIRLGELVKQHASAVDATGKSIGDRVVSDAGLTGAKADALRNAFDQRFTDLATAAKRTALRQMEAAGVKLPRKLRGAMDDLTKLTNTGAFDNAKWDSLVRKRLDLPGLTPEASREILRRANAMQLIPEGNQKSRAAINILNYIAKQRGLKVGDLASAFWYANTLSGVTTPTHIMLDNAGELAGNTLTAMISSPGAIPRIPGALARGLGKGALQAADILRNGTVTGINAELRQAHALELDPFTGWRSVLNNWKYVGRMMSATHIVLFKPAMELKSELVARRVASEEGLSGPALRQRVADIIGNTEARVNAAKAQAVGEGLTGLDLRRRTGEIIEQQREQSAPGITETSREFAQRSTYLNKPYGWAGKLGAALSDFFSKADEEGEELQHALRQGGIVRRGVLSPMVGIARVLPRLAVLPFARMVGNIVDEKLNWTPVGAIRAWRGSETGKLYGSKIADSDAVRELYVKSALGTIATVAAANFLTITGNGPINPAAKKQLMETGWRPHSIKVGDAYVSYLRTPAALGLAAVGNYQDAQRYKHLDDEDMTSRVGYAFSGVSDAIINQSYFDSLGSLFEAVKNPNPKTAAQGWETMLARTGSRFVVPNAVTQIDRVFDPTVYAPQDVKGLLAAQVPYLRRDNQPVINVLGEPIQRGIFDRDIAWAKPDPLWTALAAKQAWVSEPSKATTIGDRARGPAHFRTITPDELYNYTKASGQQIRLKLLGSLGKIQAMDPAHAKAFVDKVVEEERLKVKDKIHF